MLSSDVNTMSWKRLCRAIDLPADRVLLDNVPRFGHSFCADGFVNYDTAVRDGRLRPGDRYAMAAVGVGATFAAMIFEH